MTRIMDTGSLVFGLADRAEKCILIKCSYQSISKVIDHLITY